MSSTVRCFGCGASVADMDGPVHAYMLAAPGCWNLYGRLLGAGYPWTQFAVDGYAVQHPGVSTPQARQSVCIHLMNLCRVLERGGRPSDGPRFLTTVVHRSYPWLEPPPPAYPLTVVDLCAETDQAAYQRLEREYAIGVWSAWSVHHGIVRRWVSDRSSLPA